MEINFFSSVRVWSTGIFINSYGATVAPEWQLKERRDSETHNTRSKKAKTVPIQAKYSTSRGL